jgi:hypothetical protein
MKTKYNHNKYKTNKNNHKNKSKTNNQTQKPILSEANIKNITKINQEAIKINHIPITKVNSDSLLYKHQENKDYIKHQETQYIVLINSQKQYKQTMVPSQYTSINQIQMRFQIIACQDPKAPITITINNANSTTLPIKLQPRYLTMRNIPNYEIQYQSVTSTLVIIQINTKYTIKLAQDELERTIEIEPQKPGSMCSKSLNNNLISEKHQHLNFSESQLESSISSQEEEEEEEEEQELSDQDSITSLINNQDKLQPITNNNQNQPQIQNNKDNENQNQNNNVIIVTKDNIITKRKPKMGDSIITQKEEDVVQVIVDYNPKIDIKLPAKYYVIKDLQAINLIQQQLLKVITKKTTVINEYQASLQIQ